MNAAPVYSCTSSHAGSFFASLGRASSPRRCRAPVQPGRPMPFYTRSGVRQKEFTKRAESLDSPPITAAWAGLWGCTRETMVDVHRSAEKQGFLSGRLFPWAANAPHPATSPTQADICAKKALPRRKRELGRRREMCRRSVSGMIGRAELTKHLTKLRGSCSMGRSGRLWNASNSLELP